MKKLISLLAAAAFIASFTSCSTRSAKTEGSLKDVISVEKLSDASYKKEKLEIAENMNMLFCSFAYNSGADRLLCGMSTRSPEFWHSNADLSEYEIVEFPEMDIGVNYDLDVSNDGTAAEFVVHADYGDLPPHEYDTYPEGYTAEDYDAVAEYKFMIKTFSPDGKLLTAVDVSDFPMEAEKNVLVEDVCFDGELLIVRIGGTYEMFGTDGKYLGEFTSDEGDIDVIAHDRDGELICILKYKDGEDDRLKLCRISSDGKLSDADDHSYDLKESIFEVMPGSGEYSIFLRTNPRIYGIKADTGEMVCLLDIVSAGLNTNNIEICHMTEDGNISVVANSSNYTGVEHKKYIQRTQEEIDSIKTISIGVTTDIFLGDHINDWNDSGGDFLVEMKIYDDSYDKRDITADQLTQDVLSGSLPDMIFSTRQGMFCDVDLTSMGAYEDLYPFIDNDDEISRDTFVPNVLECLERDGKLEYISDRFDVNLPIIAKTKFVGTEKGWDIDRRLDLILNSPIEILIDPDTKHNRESYYLNWYDWIDGENMTCNFMDESFVKWLGFCNEAEKIDDEYAEMTSEEWEALWNDPEYRKEMDEKSRREQRAYIDDTRLISSEGICTYSNYLDLTKGKFGGEPITLLQDPYISTFSTISITKNSKNKDFAWQFIKSMLTDEYYSNNLNTAPLPITKTGLKLYGEDEKEPNSYIASDSDYFGQDLSDYTGRLYIIGEGDVIKIGSVTDELIAEVDELIAAAVPEPHKFYPDNDLWQIAREEIDNYYYGNCTAEKCAEVLQNRAETYLSEHYD